jgi:hypothetical protein
MQSLDPIEIKSLELNWTCTHLIRNGVPMDGSCFFHSIFYAYRSFREKTIEQRKEYIKEKRSHLATSMDVHKWLNIQKGSVAFIQIIEMMRNTIFEIFETIKGHKKTSQMEVTNNEIVQILFNLLDIDTVDQQILLKWDEECSRMEENFDSQVFLDRMKSVWYRLYYDFIIERIQYLENTHQPPILMTMEEKLKVVHKLASTSYIIFDLVLEKSLKKFQTEIKTFTSWVDVYSYLYIMEELDLSCKIILIDATTKQVFKGMKILSTFDDTYEEDNDEAFLILLYYPDSHFEPIGKIMYAEDGTKSLSRFFSYEDDIIQQIHYFVNNM